MPPRSQRERAGRPALQTHRNRPLAVLLPQRLPPARDLQSIRVFVSSPGDVGEERERARRVITRLAARYRGRLAIEPFFWEHEPVRATASFQPQIPSPADFEILICILWSRLGTRLPKEFRRSDGSRYESGTEWEFEQAVESFRKRGLPDFLVYRKSADTPLPLNRLGKEEREERIRQYDLLQQFVRRWFFDPSEGTLQAGFHEFETAAQFEERLGTHLEKLIKEHVGPQEDAPEAVIWTEGSPFRGLEPFEFEHAAVFFGRDHLISLALERVRAGSAEGCAFLLLVGLSGGGKSSLARAGILPMLLTPGVLEGVGHCRRAVMRPGERGGDPFLALADALVDERALPELLTGGKDAAALAKDLRADPEGAGGLIRGGLLLAAGAAARKEGLDKPPETRLILLVDQLEELLHSVRDVASRTAFVRLLSRLARSGGVVVIATLRSDFYGALLGVEEVAELKEAGQQLDVLPPTQPELAAMIKRPAEAAGLIFERDAGTNIPLDDVILAAAREQPGALPLLEFLLAELHARRRGRALTFEAYLDIAGLAGALAGRAEDAFSALDEKVRARWDVVMSLVVGTGDDGEGTARRRWGRLALLSGDAAALALVEALTRARLFVRAGRADGEAEFSIAHEALLEHWKRLRDWVGENRDALRARERFEEAARGWQESGRSVDLLWSGPRLQEDLRRVVARDEERLSRLELEFVEASRRRARKLRMLRRGAVATLAALTVTSFLLFLHAREAQAGESRARRLAEWNEYRSLISLADLCAISGERDSALRVLEACPEELRGQEWQALVVYLGRVEWELTSKEVPGAHTLRFTDNGSLEVLTPLGLAIKSSGTLKSLPLLPPDAGAGAGVLAAAWGGHPFLYGSDDKDSGVLVGGPRRDGVKFLTDRQEEEERSGQEGVALRSVRFSGGGDVTAVLLKNGSIYARADPGEPVKLSLGARGTPDYLAFDLSPDGEWIAATTLDANPQIHLWRVEPDGPVFKGSEVLNGGSWTGVSVDARDGRVVLAAAEAKQALAFSQLRDGERKKCLSKQLSDEVTCLQVLVEPPIVAVGTELGFVHLFDLGRGIETSVFPAQDFGIEQVALSPDGARVATLGERGDVRTWRVTDLAQQALGETQAGLQHPLVYYDSESRPRAAAFPQSGRSERTALFWSLETRTTSIVDSRGCHGVARGCGDGALVTWALAGPRTIIRVLDEYGREITLDRHPEGLAIEGETNAVVQSPDDRRLYLSATGQLICVSLDEPEPIRALGDWDTPIAPIQGGGAWVVKRDEEGSILCSWHPPAAPAEVAKVAGRIGALDADDRGLVVAGTESGEVYAWLDIGMRGERLTPVSKEPLGAGGRIERVDLLDGTDRMLVQESEGLSFWVVARGRFERLADVPGGPFEDLVAVDWDPRGEWLVGLGREGQVWRWRLRQGAAVPGAEQEGVGEGLVRGAMPEEIQSGTEKDR